MVSLTSVDVLNRYPNLEDQQQSVHILRYIFPRQFGLHNVFTSKVDARETAMAFKDYTLREKEILQAMYRETSKDGSDEQLAKWRSKVPKRLRGEPLALVDKLRKSNRHCAYMELLRHYCPVEVRGTSNTLILSLISRRAYLYRLALDGERIHFSLAWMHL
jgi:hypothetical protein